MTPPPSRRGRLRVHRRRRPSRLAHWALLCALLLAAPLPAAALVAGLDPPIAPPGYRPAPRAPPRIPSSHGRAALGPFRAVLHAGVSACAAAAAGSRSSNW